MDIISFQPKIWLPDFVVDWWSTIYFGRFVAGYWKRCSELSWHHDWLTEGRPKCEKTAQWRTIRWSWCTCSLAHGMSFQIWKWLKFGIKLGWKTWASRKRRVGGGRVAEVAREHGWHPPKSLDSGENFKPEHTLFCRELRFFVIYALFFGDFWA